MNARESAAAVKESFLANQRELARRLSLADPHLKVEHLQAKAVAMLPDYIAARNLLRRESESIGRAR
jgi:hypothetical protein